MGSEGWVGTALIGAAVAAMLAGGNAALVVVAGVLVAGLLLAEGRRPARPADQAGPSRWRAVLGPRAAAQLWPAARSRLALLGGVRVTLSVEPAGLRWTTARWAARMLPAPARLTTWEQVLAAGFAPRSRPVRHPGADPAAHPLAPTARGEWRAVLIRTPEAAIRLTVLDADRLLAGIRDQRPGSQPVPPPEHGVEQPGEHHGGQG